MDILSKSNFIDLKENFYNKSVYAELDKIINNINTNLNSMDELALELGKICDGTITVKHNDRDGYYDI